MEVKIVRLASGEELLARIEVSDEGITFHRAMILFPDPQTEELQFRQFMPYGKGFEDGLFVPNSYLAFTVTPQLSLVTHYEKEIWADEPQIAMPAEKKIILG